MYQCQSCVASSPAMHTIAHSPYCPGQMFAGWIAVNRDTYAHTGYECGAL